MAKPKTYGKSRQRKLITVPLNNPVVYCNMTRIAMMIESIPQLRQPK